MYRAPKTSYDSFFKMNIPFYGIVFLVLCLGITLGSIAACNMQGEQSATIQQLLEYFIKQVGTINFSSIDLIKLSFFNDLLLIVVIYFLGLTVIGMPIMLALIFCRGFILGFTVSFLLKEKAYHGIILAFCSILPQNLLYLPALVAAGATSLSFAILLLKRNFGTGIKLWPVFLSYNGLMLTILTLALGSSLIEAYVTPFLTKFAVRMIT
ncbi:stage II sporulation protein M [Desulfofarcimen acetoxidans DSM 771]|uniref:Stage II sporulation protein M n=1 Tax=Desulfofarcimen acetoxidans (strain ATCC 49208 / DSM 771 / KCTC 5769 / VKM B-1644 / 5575) TaxID=485916 RepID=C8VYW9_DESAS|nr:stage II sporulation protein M [Desulfofarcimen acetoxidans]ACV62879.1 stage II sporulation protein M [Desulfofarcimen acetoxidans DSM 771]